MTNQTKHPAAKAEQDRVVIFDTTLRDGEQSPGATMTHDEKLEIAEMLRGAMERRFGGEGAERFHSFDTICSATQERQDAVLELIGSGCDLMIVIGGFNSSNTNHLVELAASSTRATSPART